MDETSILQYGRQDLSVFFRGRQAYYVIDVSSGDDYNISQISAGRVSERSTWVKL